MRSILSTCLIGAFIAFASACGSNRESATEKGYPGSDTEQLEGENEALTHEGEKHAEEATEQAAMSSKAANDTVGMDPHHAAAAAGSEVDEERREFMADIQKRKDELEAKIKELQAKADQKGDKAKKEISAEIAQLDAKRKNLDTKLDEIGKASGEAWKEMKKGVEDAAGEVDAAFKKIGDDFEKRFK